MKTTSRVRGVVLCSGLALGLAAPALGIGNAANLMFPLDGSYSVVPFSANGAQGSGPAAPGDPLQRNDDDFAGAIALPVTFSIYGQNFNSVFINNNGNLTFGNGDSGFTPFAFPAVGAPRVAPFFADVDTRNLASGVAHYRVDPTALIVTWDNVGYFGNHADKTNTFQVAISNGSDPRMGIGNNVCFSYDNMDWTTGDASGGAGGFGGSDATVGVNAGNGADFFRIGRFDRAGAAYNGPDNADSGVDFLDNLDICLNVSGTQNQAPIAVGGPGNGQYCLDVTLGDSLNTLINFIGPEIGDLVTITGVLDFDAAQAAGLVLNPTSPGNPATLGLNWTPDLGDLGIYDLRVNFQDSFGAASVYDFQIKIIPTPSGMALLGVAGLIARRRRRVG